MLELQVPLLAAKALILLLLFAFVYAVMSRSIGDLRKIPDDEPYVPGQSRERNGRGPLVGEQHRLEERRLRLGTPRAAHQARGPPLCRGPRVDQRDLRQRTE